MGRYRIVRTWHKLERVDQEFYDNTIESLTLIEPKLTLAMNENGSLEFTVPCTHKYFTDISPMADEFMVRDEIKNETLFVGRPISCKVNDFKTLDVYCEGAMGYLHDILIRPSIWESTTPDTFFRDVINRYNEIKRPRVPYQFITPGACTIPVHDIYRSANYETAYDMLKRGCLETDGGYFIMDYDSLGEKRLNWYDNPPQRLGVRQKVKYGYNIVSYEETYDMTGRATVILPLGAEIEEDLPGNLGKKKVVGDICAYALTGWEQDSLETTIKNHGYVEELKEYSEAKTVNEIREAIMRDRIVGEMNLDYQGTIDCRVADMYFIDDTINGFYIGQVITFENMPTSPPYNKWNDLIYVKKIEYDLDSAVPTITIGTRDAQNLSDQFKRPEKEEKTQSPISSEGGSSSGSEGGGNSEGLLVDEFIIPFPEIDIIEPIVGEMTVLGRG